MRYIVNQIQVRPIKLSVNIHIVKLLYYPYRIRKKLEIIHRLSCIGFIMTWLYLLKGLSIQRSNQVWATNITYIPMAKGFVYLCAVIDWHSRKVLAHSVSISMEVAFCIETLNEAIEKYGRPEIFNTDQGSQFTSDAFIEV